MPHLVRTDQRIYIWNQILRGLALRDGQAWINEQEEYQTSFHNRKKTKYGKLLYRKRHEDAKDRKGYGVCVRHLGVHTG